MLKHVDPLLNADLLYLLAAMGHGDELAVVDSNFPAQSTANRLVRFDGVDSHQIAKAIFSVFPLDTFVDEPLVRMEVVGRPDEIPPVQSAFRELAEEAEGRTIEMGSLEREAFYARVRDAFGVVATGEHRPYGCFLLVKGVTHPEAHR